VKLCPDLTLAEKLSAACDYRRRDQEPSGAKRDILAELPCQFCLS